MYERLKASKIQQTAILKDIDIPEVRVEPRRRAAMTQTRFKWLVVLTQDCDLDLDRHARRGTNPNPGGTPVSKDKILRMALLCPAYPLDEVLLGTYLRPVTSKKWGHDDSKTLVGNHHERYHVLQADNKYLLEQLVLDFKMVVGAPPPSIWSDGIAIIRKAEWLCYNRLIATT